MLRNLIATLVLALTLAPPAAAQSIRPVDEVLGGSELADFRARLFAAARQQDTAAVLDVTTEDVMSSFGGNRGPAAFRAFWFSGEGSDRDLFQVLEDVLSAGGEFLNDSTFSAPYTYTAFPEGVDPFEHAVVTGSRVRIRDRPGLSAEVLGHRSHEVVRAPDLYEVRRADGHSWARVELPDGRTGWMSRRYLRSPLDYRVVLVRRGGLWQIRSLVAGD